MASKSRYTDTYRKEGNKWLLLSSFVNNLVEPYYQLRDTAGIWAAIKKQYEMLDKTVENKDLCQHLSLKTLDFSTIDGRGNFASPQFMRNRSRILFNALRDSIESNNKAESIGIKDDTVKVVVLQEFNRKQMAGGKPRYFQTLARQRESWMLARDRWKLVFVDKVKALARIIDGIKTEPETPINWNAPPFNQ